MGNQTSESEFREKLLQHAYELVEAGNARNVPLRLLGALAFINRCPTYSHWHESFGRVLTDIDLVTYGKHRDKVHDILASKGFDSSHLLALSLGAPDDRIIAEHPEKKIHVDVFLDKLRMCHEIDFRGRLEGENLTIPLPEMFLEKTQIVKINEKDINDVIILLREHSLGESGVDIKRIARVLSSDWGFYHTVEKNLQTIRERLGNYDVLTAEDRSDVDNKIQSILTVMQDQPKGMKWKMRAKIGESKVWYNEVEESGR